MRYIRIIVILMMHEGRRVPDDLILLLYILASVAHDLLKVCLRSVVRFGRHAPKTLVQPSSIGASALTSHKSPTLYPEVSPRSLAFLSVLPGVSLYPRFDPVLTMSQYLLSAFSIVPVNFCAVQWLPSHWRTSLFFEVSMSKSNRQYAW
jgi:hypothetical protein